MKNDPRWWYGKKVARLIVSNFFSSILVAKIHEIYADVFSIFRRKNTHNHFSQKDKLKSGSRAAKAQQICMLLIFFRAQKKTGEKLRFINCKLFFYCLQNSHRLETSFATLIEVDIIKKENENSFWFTTVYNAPWFWSFIVKLPNGHCSNSKNSSQTFHKNPSFPQKLLSIPDEAFREQNFIVKLSKFYAKLFLRN